jgi:hypothetical protein
MDKYFILLALTFVFACGGNEEQQEKNQQNRQDVESNAKSYEIPLSGFELSHINLDSLKDDLRLDSFGHFDAAYHEHISDFLADPYPLESSIEQGLPVEDRFISTLLYYQYKPKDGYKAFDLPKYNAQIIFHTEAVFPADSLLSDTAQIDSLVEPELIHRLVEIAAFAQDTSDVTQPDLVFKHGVVVGMHYNELVSKLGIGFVKKGNRLFYHDWKDRVGIFEVNEEGIVQKIIIGRYSIDLSLEAELPSFFVNYDSF